jgi:thiol-disulfide isomerase/thioredoxin
MMTANQKSRMPCRSVLCWRLLALCLAISVGGCDESPRRHRAGGGSHSPADVVAQLLAENEPFDFDFDLDDVNGNHLSKGDFDGKVLIVDLWGTWCPPCRAEVPHFVALYRQYADQGLQVIGMNDEQRGGVETEARIVRKYCKDYDVDYPCAIITRAIKRQVPDYGSFPTTLFIDRAGKVRLKLLGYHDLPILQAAVEALLKEQAPGATADPTEESGKPDDPAENPAKK